MQSIQRIIIRPIRPLLKSLPIFSTTFSTTPSGCDNVDPPAHNLGWDDGPSSTAWSTGLTKEHFDGEVVGRQVGHDQTRFTDREIDVVKELQGQHKWSRGFIDGFDHRLQETADLLNQVREPGSRGSYLKDSEKTEMYKKHKENPEVYTVERLAKEYRIIRQRVHAILWLKELEEEDEKKLGKPLDDSVEILLDTLPEYFISHDREFHVAALPYKPDFKVMPEGWDGTTKDPDQVHYEISMKEDEKMYQEFVQRMNFNKMKMANQVKVHKYSRRRPSEGWNFMAKMATFDILTSSVRADDMKNHSTHFKKDCQVSN